MATVVFTDGFISVNSVDLSDHMQSGTLVYQADVLDTTAMGGGTTHTKKVGLLDWNVDVTFFNDFAGGSVDATLFPLVGAVPFPLEIRAVKTGGRSATNPGYNGNVVCSNHTPIGGKVGDMLMTSPKFIAASPLLRSTA